MIRYEEIREAASNYIENNSIGGYVQISDHKDSFIEGAEWADTNPKSPWINVNNDLPCNYENLIYLKNKEQTVGILACINDTGTVYFTNMKMVDEKWELEEIVTPDYNYRIPTHWMPIPKLPKK